MPDNSLTSFNVTQEWEMSRSNMGLDGKSDMGIRKTSEDVRRSDELFTYSVDNPDSISISHMLFTDNKNIALTDNKNSRFYTANELDPIIEEHNQTKSTSKILDD